MTELEKLKVIHVRIVDLLESTQSDHSEKISQVEPLENVRIYLTLKEPWSIDNF